MEEQTEKISYQELELPYYRNSYPAVSVRTRQAGKERTLELSVSDVIKAIVLCGNNLLLVSKTGGGKTQLLKDIFQHYFGGNVSEGGHCNWKIARKDQDMDILFREFDKDKLRWVTRNNRLEALVNVVDELNRTHPLNQNDFFDLAVGEKEIEGEARKLGREDYCLFMGAMNLNKFNTDYSGISEVDSALLSRAHHVMDLDFCKPLEKERAEIDRDSNPKLLIAKPRDISDKILAVFKKLRSEPTNEYLLAYMQFLNQGLGYCEQDELKEKADDWPMTCGDCKARAKDLCSLMRECEPRSSRASLSLAKGIEFIISLKEGGDVEIDPLDLAFEAFKFTAYHGNLNRETLLSKYKARNQYMMNVVISELKDKIKQVKPYLDNSIELAKEKGEVCTDYIECTIWRKRTFPYYAEIERALREKRVNYTKFNPFDEFQDKTGIGTSWIRPYLENLASQSKKQS